MWHLSSSARDAHFGISSQQLEETHRPPGAPDDAFGNPWSVLLRSLPPGDTCAEPGHLQCPAGPPSHSLGADTALRTHIHSPLATTAKEVDGMKARRHPTEQGREALPILGCVPLSCGELFGRCTDVLVSRVYIYIITRGWLSSLAY